MQRRAHQGLFELDTYTVRTMRVEEIPPDYDYPGGSSHQNESTPSLLQLLLTLVKARSSALHIAMQVNAPASQKPLVMPCSIDAATPLALASTDSPVQYLQVNPAHHPHQWQHPVIQYQRSLYGLLLLFLLLSCQPLLTLPAGALPATAYMVYRHVHSRNRHGTTSSSSTAKSDKSLSTS